jgi:hypothetical protein
MGERVALLVSAPYQARSQTETPMHHLQIHLLGSPRVDVAGTPCRIGNSRALALLAYLAVTGATHTRESCVIIRINGGSLPLELTTQLRYLIMVPGRAVCAQVLGVLHDRSCQ